MDIKEVAAKGGRARWAKMTKKERSEHAKKMVAARVNYGRLNPETARAKARFEEVTGLKPTRFKSNE